MILHLLNSSILFFSIIITTTATQKSYNKQHYSIPIPNNNNIHLFRGGAIPNSNDDDDDDDGSSSNRRRIVILGSSNLDTFLSVDRLPRSGENLSVLNNSKDQQAGVIHDVPGGKGLNQAVACARLSSKSSSRSSSLAVSFVGRFGNDIGATLLRSTLLQEGIDLDGCNNNVEDGDEGDEIAKATLKSNNKPSGRGYVFLERSTGQVSAVVDGGSNTNGWSDGWAAIPAATTIDNKVDNTNNNNSNCPYKIPNDTCLILMQREVPEFVNICLA